MTLEEAIMANYSQKAKKIKTPFAKMIVEGNQEKPYFSILYFDPIDKDFYVGYSSYCLDYVSNWLNEEFEIVEDENFIIAALRPVRREQVEKVFPGCEKCRNQANWPSWIEKGFVYCPKCGTPLASWAWEKQMERLEALKDE